MLPILSSVYNLHFGTARDSENPLTCQAERATLPVVRIPTVYGSTTRTIPSYRNSIRRLAAIASHNVSRFMVFILLANVKEHAPLSARVSVDHGVEVVITGNHVTRTAPSGWMVRLVRCVFLFWARPAREWTLAGGY